MSISAHDEIRNMIGIYSLAVDDRDFDTVGRCFTEDAVASYTNLDIPPGRASIVEFIEGVQRTVLSQHFLLPMIVNVNGEEADSLCYGLAVLVQNVETGERSVGRGLRYTDKWRRTDAGWQIYHRIQQADWTWDLPVQTNPGAMWHADPAADAETTIFRSL